MLKISEPCQNGLW